MNEDLRKCYFTAAVRKQIVSKFYMLWQMMNPIRAVMWHNQAVAHLGMSLRWKIPYIHI